MARYKIGITEAGDAGLDLSWENKLKKVDGAILITKNITSDFISAALRNKDKVIVHATCTGYGKTAVEPNVPRAEYQLGVAKSLVDCGFPREKIVIRVDPIIPTEKGVVRACNIIKTSILLGFDRFRISVLDMYPHVRKRFADAGLPDPYNGCFTAPNELFKNVNIMVRACKLFYLGVYAKFDGLRIEACADPMLDKDKDVGVIPCGCISDYDLALFGLDPDGENDGNGFQRLGCKCYGGKVELLNHKKQCPNGCLYCYWK